MDNEEWRPVPVAEYSDHYEISNFGRVRRTKVVPGCRAGRILATTPDDRGRHTVHLCANHKRRRLLLHTLVLTAFVGPRPPGLVGCHNDGDVANNRLPNLRWDSQKENIADIRRHGRVLTGERSNSARLNAEQVMMIRRRSPRGREMDALAAELGVCRATIDNVVSRRTWRHL